MAGTYEGSNSNSQKRSGKMKLAAASESAAGQRGQEKIAADRLNQAGAPGCSIKSPLLTKAPAESQAGVLDNADIPIIQRQVMAAQIGTLHGNRHMQRVMDIVKRQPAKATAPDPLSNQNVPPMIPPSPALLDRVSKSRRGDRTDANPLRIRSKLSGNLVTMVQRQHVRMVSGRYVGDLPGATANMREEVLQVMDRLHYLWSISNADYNVEYPRVSSRPARSNIAIGDMPSTIAAIRHNETRSIVPRSASDVLGLTLGGGVGRGQPNQRTDVYRLQDELHRLWYVNNSDYTTERAALNAGSDPAREVDIPKTIEGITKLKKGYVAGTWRRGPMAGTRRTSAGEQTRVRSELTPGVPAGSTFRNNVGGRSYRQRLWRKLNDMKKVWFYPSNIPGGSRCANIGKGIEKCPKSVRRARGLQP